MKRSKLAGLVAVTATLVATVAAPASAGSVRVVDGDDSTMLADIHRVRVTHTEKWVRVRIRFDDLAGSGLRRTQALSIFLDTDAARTGPEYRFQTGLNRGTDYRLHKVKSWGAPGRHVDDCGYRLKIDWTRDLATLAVPRACLKDPAKVAAAVKAVEWNNKGTKKVDWMTARRAFSPAVAAG
ncbi:hypothetical protein [Nocardioides gilvus]|uniref:hypothetical protein n=1 Tax=Nocardioides gilvus TaxID=1735589 RepID=UPI000D749E0F|nr:hypothetical protein [Nocardioides gilvus]